jgi:hypothetical protein
MFATFTWSVGCTLATITMKKSGLTGFPLVFALGIGFVVALGIAVWLGTGVLDVEAGLSDAGNPVEFVLTFVEVAIKTYGPIGAALGLGLGAWLGTRVAPLVDDGFLL